MLRLCCNVVLSITGTAVLGISAQMKTFGWIFTPLTLVRLGWYTSTVDPFAETANGWSFHGTLGNCIPPTRVFEVEAAKGGYKLAIDIFSFQSIQHLSARFSLGSISTYINPTKDSSLANTTCPKTLPVFFPSDRIGVVVTLEMVHLVAETCDKLEKDGQMIISYQETVMVQLVVSQKMVRFFLVKQVRQSIYSGGRNH